MSSARLILDASAPVSSVKAKPFTLEEIDTHPERDRIWATITLLKKHFDETNWETAYAMAEEMWGDE